ncbi:cytochrome P450 [Camillea tinctor]|nr:cytochrome P450 [Camillea tinctor]
MVFIVTRGIYRLYLHPLCHFPGPRRAALSNDWIYTISRAGKLEEAFERLHRKYDAKAIRIAPNELHISDVSLYKVIYNQTSQFLKEAAHYDAFMTYHTTFSELNPEKHRIRRRKLNNYFSKTSINKIESLIVGKIELMKRRINVLKKTQSINVYNCFRCITTDIICQYAFRDPKDMIEKTSNNFDGGFIDVFDQVTKITWDMKYRPIMRKISYRIPESLGRLLSPAANAVVGMRNEVRKSIRRYREDPVSEYPTILGDLILETSDESLVLDEAISIVVAGSDTTAYSLSVGMWHILSTHWIQQRLVGELRDHIPDKEKMPTLVELERLPFLMACMRESIRVARAVPGRLPRLVPKGMSLVIDGKVVPPGTVVGMSAYTMHTSEELWGPDAREFNPGRWIQDNAKTLDQHMVSFSKGVRSCIGQNLAYAEATLILAYMFRQYDLSLSDGSSNTDSLDKFASCLRPPGILVNMRSSIN